MARRNFLNDALVVSCKIEKDMLNTLQDLAALESLHTGRTVSVQELIRNALTYVYTDNERLREAFRRSRAHVSKRLKIKY